MHSRIEEHIRQGALWKLVTNPAFEVIAAIVVVLLATWVLVEADAFQGGVAPVPIRFGHK